MIVIAMTGCPGNRTATATREGKPHAGVTLKIACEDAVVLEAFASRAQGWAGRSGASVAKSAAADADIIIGSSAEVGARAATADAQPVPEALKALEHPGQWIRMLTPYRDTLAAWAGQPCAIPLAGDGAVLVFNTTALTDAKLTEAYRAKFGQPLPNPPRTWDDLAEISEACVAAGRKAGLAPRDPLADFLRAAAAFDRPALAEAPRGSMAAISFTHVADTGTPRLTSPGFEAAARWHARMKPGATPTSALTALAHGDAAFAILSLAELGGLPKDVARTVPAHLHPAPLPGSRAGARVNLVPYFHGGWFGIVRTTCSAPAAAFDLLADLGSPARSLELMSDPALGFGPFRQEHLEQSRDAVWQAYSFDADRTRALADALRQNVGVTVANPAFGLRGPDAKALSGLLVESLDSMPAAQKAWLEHDAKQPNARAWRRHAAGLE